MPFVRTALLRSIIGVSKRGKKGLNLSGLSRYLSTRSKYYVILNVPMLPLTPPIRLCLFLNPNKHTLSQQELQFLTPQAGPLRIPSLQPMIKRMRLNNNY